MFEESLETGKELLGGNDELNKDYSLRKSSVVFTLSSMDTVLEKAAWGGKGLEESQVEHSSRSRDRNHGGVPLAGLLPMANSAYFLIQPRTPCPGKAPFTVGNEYSRKDTTDWSTGWSDGDNSSVVVLSSQMALPSSCHVDRH